MAFPFANILLFIAFSFYFLLISRKALRNPRCHGFYRFFVFEGVLILVLLNHSFWFIDVFALRQVVSWLLLSASILFVLQGLQLLRKVGGSQARDEMPENFSFENTAILVSEGIYRYIRHPMYSSLLLLAWGVYFKHLSLAGFGVALLTSVYIYLAGRMEEKENLVFFGPTYEKYRKGTKMFLPFLW